MSNQIANEIMKECEECGYDCMIQQGKVYCNECLIHLQDEDSEDEDNEDSEDEYELELTMLKYENIEYFKDINTNVIYNFDLTLDNLKRLGVWNTENNGIDFDWEALLK